MKVNHKTLNLVVDLMLNQIYRECSTFKGFKEMNLIENLVDKTLDNVDECNTKIIHGGKVNETTVEEEVEEVDEQMEINSRKLAKKKAAEVATRRAATQTALKGSRSKEYLTQKAKKS